jgi:hypothetical protein
LGIEIFQAINFARLRQVFAGPRLNRETKVNLACKSDNAILYTKIVLYYLSREGLFRNSRGKTPKGTGAGRQISDFHFFLVGRKANIP